MQYNIVFIPANAGISEADRSISYIHGQPSTPFGQLWYCPICAKIWIIIKAQIAGTTEYTRYTAVCNECECCAKGKLLLAKTRLTLPGSVLMEGYNTIDELSVEMLRRELLLELKAIKVLINQGVL